MAILDFWGKGTLNWGQGHLQPHLPHLQWSFLDVSNKSKISQFFKGQCFPLGQISWHFYSLKYPLDIDAIRDPWIRSYFLHTNKFYINGEPINLHFQEGHMTCILTTLYGFPCNEKQKKPEYGILKTLSFSDAKL